MVPGSVFVTGAGGYLGSAIVRALAGQGIAASGCDLAAAPGIVACDLCDTPRASRLLAEASPDVVIHTAAFVPKSPEDYANADYADRNLAMVRSVIGSGARKVVFISSMTVYGIPGMVPVQETQAAPLSAYAIGKLEGERVLAAAGQRHVAPRLPGLFGLPRKDGLIGNVLRAAIRREVPQLPPSPVTWAAMHIEDAASSVVALALSDMEGPINVGYDGPMSISRFVALVERDCGVHFDYPVEQPDFAMDLSRLASCGGMPAATFHQRIRAMAVRLQGDLRSEIDRVG
jgi:nucleoside-diphosphate-sugar epimerase